MKLDADALLAVNVQVCVEWCRQAGLDQVMLAYVVCLPTNGKGPAVCYPSCLAPADVVAAVGEALKNVGSDVQWKGGCADGT